MCEHKPTLASSCVCIGRPMTLRGQVRHGALPSCERGVANREKREGERERSYRLCRGIRGTRRDEHSLCSSPRLPCACTWSG